MRHWKVIGLIVGLVLCATLVSVALASGAARQHRGKATAVHTQRTTHRVLATSKRSGTDPGEQNTESEVTPGDSTVDGVEQAPGADHQCPPNCAPGENP